MTARESHGGPAKAVAAPGLGKSPRNQAIEALRIAAAFGIIAYHAGAAFHELAYAGLIVFLILSPMLDTRYNFHRRRSLGELARALLLPWAFWLVFYGALNIARHMPFIPQDNPVGHLLLGTSAHLWFLPFMFGVLVLLDRAKISGDALPLFWACAIGASAILATASIWRLPSLAWPSPFPQWMHGLAAPMVGVVFGLRRKVGGIAWIGVAMVFAALLVALAAHLPGVGIPFATGMVLVLAIGSIPDTTIPAHWTVQPVASCMMGVYLTHMFVLGIVGKFVAVDHYAAVVLTFVTSLLIVWLARRFLPFTRLVVG